LTARTLEANGITTVVIGSALDIVERCGVPRYLHNDIPLGNSLGHPYRAEEQLHSVRLALSLIANSTEPVIRKSSLRWHNGESWRSNYMKVDESNREALKLAGEENRRRRREQIDKGEKR
jgi:D-proline reductase (dithiol) PrdB